MSGSVNILFYHSVSTYLQLVKIHLNIFLKLCSLSRFSHT